MESHLLDNTDKRCDSEVSRDPRSRLLSQLWTAAAICTNKLSVLRYKLLVNPRLHERTSRIPGKAGNIGEFSEFSRSTPAENYRWAQIQA